MLIDWLSNEHNRAIVYRFALGLIPLLVMLDLLTGEMGDQILRSLEIVLAVSVSGLATKNTERRPRFEPRDPLS